MSKIIGATVAAIAVTAIIIGLAFGLGWVGNRYDSTITRERLDVESRNREASYERQQSLIDSAQRQVVDYRRLDPESGQAKAIAAQVCASLAKVRGDLPTDLVDFDVEVCA
jgi:hypothetical protein